MQENYKNVWSRKAANFWQILYLLFLPCSLVANNACLLFIVQQQDVNRLSTCGNEKLLSSNLQLQLFSSWVTIIVSLFNSPQKLTYAGQPYLTFKTTKYFLFLDNERSVGQCPWINIFYAPPYFNPPPLQSVWCVVVLRIFILVPNFPPRLILDSSLW